MGCLLQVERDNIDQVDVMAALGEPGCIPSRASANVQDVELAGGYQSIEEVKGPGVLDREGPPSTSRWSSPPWA